MILVKVFQYSISIILGRRPLKIHVWGGFGSQLFGLAFFHLLQKELKSRKLLLVFHSSGVTERHLEIESLLTGIEYRVRKDFKHSQMNKIGSVQLAKLARPLERLRFIVRVETEDDVRNIKFWTLDVRGHYSRLSISNDILMRLFSSLRVTQRQFEASNDLVLHYRLGDLVVLDNKTYVDPQSLSPVLVGLFDASHLNENLGICLTESIVEAKEQLSKIGLSENFTYLTIDPFKTILVAVEAKSFVGTNSKLSLWISIFRAHVRNRDSYLPKAIGPSVFKVIPHTDPGLIRLYD